MKICWACWAFSLAASEVIHPLLSAIRNCLFTFRSLGEVNGLPPSQRFCQDDTQHAFSCRFAWFWLILHVLKSVTRPKKSCTAAASLDTIDKTHEGDIILSFLSICRQQNVSPEEYKHLSGQRTIPRNVCRMLRRRGWRKSFHSYPYLYNPLYKSFRLVQL